MRELASNSTLSVAHCRWSRNCSKHLRGCVSVPFQACFTRLIDLANIAEGSYDVLVHGGIYSQNLHCHSLCTRGLRVAIVERNALKWGKYVN